MVDCPECSFVAKSASGLSSHRRARHGVSGAGGGTVARAVEGEQRADILRALMRRLAKAVDDADGSELPALAKQLREVATELERIGPKDASRLDELQARRRARVAEAQTP